jgi:hypothetical protein
VIPERVLAPVDAASIGRTNVRAATKGSVPWHERPPMAVLGLAGIQIALWWDFEPAGATTTRDSVMLRDINLCRPLAQPVRIDVAIENSANDTCGRGLMGGSIEPDIE